MDFFTLSAHRLRGSERRFIVDHLTRPGSDFQQALLAGVPKGTICLCVDQGEIVGWARTEEWHGLPTLEAFVGQSYRRRGIAKACAACLLAEGALTQVTRTAVFNEPMQRLAEDLGIVWSRFDRKPDGTWQLA